jgi:hypothetical protein
MSKTTLRWAIIVLTAVTALIHLGMGISGLIGGDSFFGPIFTLNGLGYLGLLAALLLTIPFLAGRRLLVLYVFVFYTALTFVLYFAFNGFSNIGVSAIIVKLAELLLIIALLLYRPHLSQAA